MDEIDRLFGYIQDTWPFFAFGLAVGWLLLYMRGYEIIQALTVSFFLVLAVVIMTFTILEWYNG